MYYRNAAAAIIVYDITNEATFEVLQEWITELNRLGPANIVLAIAGNKCDLEETREVSEKSLISHLSLSLSLSLSLTHIQSYTHTHTHYNTSVLCKYSCAVCIRITNNTKFVHAHVFEMNSRTNSVV